MLPLRAHRFAALMMDSMLSLLPQDEPAGSLFLGLYMRRLPQDMRDHLATRQFDSPHQMAETADLLWDARSHGAASAPLMSSELVAAAYPRRVASPNSRRRRSPSPRPRDASPSSLCFYHRKYGPAARNCQPPCTWGSDSVWPSLPSPGSSKGHRLSLSCWAGCGVLSTTTWFSSGPPRPLPSCCAVGPHLLLHLDSSLHLTSL